MRRSRATCNPELRALLRLIATFNAADLALAETLVAADFSISRAAESLAAGPDTEPPSPGARPRTDAIRQRLVTIVRKLKRAFPGLDFRRGGPAFAFSYDRPARGAHTPLLETLAAPASHNDDGG